LVAEQVKVVPVVSEFSVTVPQPVDEEMPDSGSVTVQLTVTTLLYQPLAPTVPLTFGVITGGVVSVGEPAVAGVTIAVKSSALAAPPGPLQVDKYRYRNVIPGDVRTTVPSTLKVVPLAPVSISNKCQTFGSSLN
jgi:hypothetical protein